VTKYIYGVCGKPIRICGFGCFALSSMNKSVNVSLNILDFVRGSFTIRPLEDFRDIRSVGGRNIEFAYL